MAQILGADNLRLVRGDVFRYLATAPKAAFDFVFADPPYDMERFDDVVPAVIESGIIKPGGLFVMEHSAKRDYSLSPCFIRHLAYGSVNFSIFLLP